MLKMLEAKKGFVVAMVLGGLLTFSQCSEAAIGYPGRTEQPVQQEQQAQEADLPYIPELAEMEAKQAQQQAQEQPVQEPMVQEASYACLISKEVKKDEQYELYDGSGDLVQFFNTLGIKHKDKFFVFCANQQVAEIQKKNLQELNFKVENPKEVSEDLWQDACYAMGTKPVVLKATWKEPGHKSWLEKNGLSLLGTVLGLGLF